MSYLGFVFKVLFVSAAIAVAIKAVSAIAIAATIVTAWVVVVAPAAIVACVLAGRAFQYSRQERDRTP